MANEAVVQSQLTIQVGNLRVQTQPSSFRAAVAGAKGPVPGAIQVTTTGLAIDFSQLTKPGLCRIINLDTTRYVEVGIADPLLLTGAGGFYPLLEILPGEFYVVRLSRFLGSEFKENLAGTGTFGSAKRLYLRAVGGSANVVVEAYES